MHVQRSHSSALFFLLTSAFLAGACRANASTSAPAQVAGCHPACPGAATAAIGDSGASLRAAPAPAPSETRAPSPAAYLCPMHLDIGSDQPGQCPKCGMTLVPRAEALEHDHAK